LRALRDVFVDVAAVAVLDRSVLQVDSPDATTVHGLVRVALHRAARIDPNVALRYD
jgi:hypothetical protein